MANGSNGKGRSGRLAAYRAGTKPTAARQRKPRRKA
jgi:hypothetical protein